MEPTKQKFDFEAYAKEKNMRVETSAFFHSLAGQEIGELEFVSLYKALGLPRTSPSKGKRLYNYLVKVGFIRTNNR